MSRYICVYYTARRKADVNKSTKRAIVIDTDDPKVVLSPEQELKQTYKAKYIKYIRNLSTYATHFQSNDMRALEYRNNFSLPINSND